MQSYQTDPNTALKMAVTCPCILLSFMMLGIFFAFPEKRHQIFPFLKEYRVKIDFNELQRLREVEQAKRAQQIKTATENAGGNRSSENTTSTDKTKTIAIGNHSIGETENNKSRQAANQKESGSQWNNPSDNIASDSSSKNHDTNQAKKDDIDTTTTLPSDPLTKLAYHATPPSFREVLPPFYIPPQLPPRKGKPLRFVKATLKGVPYYQTTIDLKDPEMFLSIQLPNNADEANSAELSHGDESFPSFVKRSRGAVVQNGTFFSKDDQKRVMGNMVTSGRYVKYSRWEDFGTTLGIKKNNEPEMITARIEGQPDWSQHWFSLTCGPRLVTNGEILIDAEKEGFQDPHVLGVAPRCAIGFPATKDKIYLVTFLMGLSLKKEAEVMKAMGCSNAMNLDGGASKAVAHNGEIVVPAHRPLTNVIVVYDTKFPAPKPLITSWKEFQRRPDQQVAVGY